MLPVVHATATEAVAELSEPERERLILSLTSIRGQLAELARREPSTPKPRRTPIEPIGTLTTTRLRTAALLGPPTSDGFDLSANLPNLDEVAVDGGDTID